MATLTVQNLTTPGAVLTFTAINSGGDEFPNNGKTIALFKNTNTTPADTVIITAATPKKIQGLSITDPTLTVPGHATIPPVGALAAMDPSLFNTAAGVVQLTYSGTAVADTLVAVVSL